VSEFEHGKGLIDSAISEAEKEGWTQELKNQYVFGCGMQDSAIYKVDTILQNFFLNDDGQWEEYSDITWEQYIDNEFNKRKPGVELTQWSEEDNKLDMKPGFIHKNVLTTFEEEKK